MKKAENQTRRNKKKRRKSTKNNEINGNLINMDPSTLQPHCEFYTI